MGRGRKSPTFPRAKSAPSKKSITPSNIKSPPNVVSATPISEVKKKPNGKMEKKNGNVHNQPPPHTHTIPYHTIPPIDEKTWSVF